MKKESWEAYQLLTLARANVCNVTRRYLASPSEDLRQELEALLKAEERAHAALKRLLDVVE